MTLLAAVAMIALALAGCGVQEKAEAGPVTVTNVDELLAAIAPGAEIMLEASTYNLSEASDYGRTSDNPYYIWQQIGNEYELVLQGIENLTIRGSGESVTTLTTEPRYADVLVLQNCVNVVLEDFSAGHTEGSECTGGVVSMRGCVDGKLSRLGLFGCGTIGVQLEDSSNIAVSDCEIYDCTSSGIWASGTDGLTVENCRIHDLLGDEWYAGPVFWLYQTGNVTVTGCEITDNTVSHFIDCYPCDNVVFQNNTFTGNRVQEAVFDVDGGLIFDSNVVENNVIPQWFDAERATVLDGIGKSWNEEMLEWYYNPYVEAESEGEQTVVHVNTVDELLSAIAPNTEIVLDAEFYDLSTAKDYGTGYNDYYYWNEEFDGPSLVITDVANLTIRSESGDVEKCTISAVPRYAHVLSFRRCSNVTLSGFTAGHTVEPGYCMGGVLFFRDCDNVLVDNCGLYGCGILGVQAELSGLITVKNSDIYECSYGGIQMSEVAGVVIEGCTFRDLGGDSLSFYDCKDVMIDGKYVAGNYRSNDYMG